LHRLIHSDEKEASDQTPCLRVFSLFEEQGKIQQGHENGLAYFDSSMHWIAFSSCSIS
jgi:hypothetical protein